MKRIALALVLACAAVGARAQSGVVPAWFAESFLEFPQDVREAAQDGRRLVLYFWQDGCPYCREMVQTTLSDPGIVVTMHRHFVAVALNIFGDREILWTDGRRLPEKALARELKIRATPTLLFLDQKGAITLRLTGYVPPARFAAALETAKEP